MPHDDILIPLDGIELGADLHSDGQAIVVFVHGSGSSRHSPRNRSVAEYLRREGFGTLLFDLLTESEAEDRRLVFDIGLLTGRLRGALAWLKGREDTAALPVGLFGASTGAAAALAVAADPASEVRAVVSRGGRPDLAIPVLPRVQAPTLLIVGGWDTEVLELNREAARHLRCPHELRVIPGATHLFEEPGTLAAAADAAGEWFRAHCLPRPQVAVG